MNCIKEEEGAVLVFATVFYFQIDQERTRKRWGSCYSDCKQVSLKYYMWLLGQIKGHSSRAERIHTVQVSIAPFYTEYLCFSFLFYSFVWVYSILELDFLRSKLFQVRNRSICVEGQKGGANVKSQTALDSSIFFFQPEDKHSCKKTNKIKKTVIVEHYF